jgi:CDP-glycerol glycerophosphotransferase (TagB/SpsB family)
LCALALVRPVPLSAILDTPDEVPVGAGHRAPASRFTEIVHGELEIFRSTVLLNRRELARAGGFDEQRDIDADWECWLRIASSLPVGTVSVPFAIQHGRLGDPLASVQLRQRERMAGDRAAVSGRSCTRHGNDGAACVGEQQRQLHERSARVEQHERAAARREPSVNLLHDTVYRRARRRVVDVLHRVDDAVSSHADVRILFEAASPMSVSVFQPVLNLLRRDPRMDVWFTSCDGSWSQQAIFEPAGITRQVLPPAAVTWRKFDLYINTDFWNMTWLKRRTRRVHLFHGVAGKYGLDAPGRFAPSVAAFDCLMFANRDRLRRYVEAGLVEDDPRQAALVGYPKVDCLVDGSLDRRALERAFRLDPAKPTVLYAPTWSPHSSLNTVGEALIRRLAMLNANVIVKIHDRSFDNAARASGGVDWRAHLPSVCRDQRVHFADGADASRYLAVADVLVTDHSSVGFEFMLLDRPVLVVDCPELIEGARISSDKVAMLRRASTVVSDSQRIADAVDAAFADPTRLSAERRSTAAELFYRPGTAAVRAARHLYDLLSLSAPAAAMPYEAAAVSTLTFEARTT